MPKKLSEQDVIGEQGGSFLPELNKQTGWKKCSKQLREQYLIRVSRMEKMWKIIK